MRDKAKTKGKKIAIIGILSCVSIAAVIGIGIMLDKGKSEEPVVVDNTVVEESGVIVNEIEPVAIDVTENTIESSDNVQPLQEEPEIPEVPTEAPELAPDTDLTNPDVEPEYVPTEPEHKPEVTPVVEPIVPTDDGSHPGQVYVPGFGWMDSGSGSTCIEAPDLVPNGNIIGDM